LLTGQGSTAEGVAQHLLDMLNCKSR
jgi:hypothetical protein